MEKILLIIPAYNEEKNIIKTCKKIDEYDKKLNYIVINDGSDDNTSKILDENKINHIDLIQNLGIGGAVQCGYKYAYDNDYDIAIQFDGDGQHDISYVYKISEPLINKKADMVIGTRYLEKSESEFQSTFMRRLGSNIISFFIKICCHKKITDPTSGFRAINKKVIKDFSEYYPTEYPEPESTVSLLINGYSILEVPVNMNERAEGTSSITSKFWKPADYMIKVVLAIIIDSISLKRIRRNKKCKKL